MPTLLHLDFEGHTLPIRQRRDGVLLFEGSALAHALGYADKHDALHTHCRLEGFAFGTQPRPAIWVDVRNAHRLAFHRETERAERFAHWLSHHALPLLSSRHAQPRRRQLTSDEQRLDMLSWQGECWLNLRDTLRLFGNAPDNALLAAAARLGSAPY